MRRGGRGGTSEAVVDPPHVSLSSRSRSASSSSSPSSTSSTYQRSVMWAVLRLLLLSLFPLRGRLLVLFLLLFPLRRRLLILFLLLLRNRRSWPATSSTLRRTSRSPAPP